MLREKRPLPGNNAHIFGVTLLFLVLAGMGFYGLLSALETGDGRWLALLFTAVTGVLVAGWRVVQHDARAFIEQERLPVKPIAQQTAPDPVVNIRTFSKPSSNSKLTAVGRFSFSRGQWYALKNTIEKCGGKMVRDPIREARPYIFPHAEIKNWRGIVGEFQRLGLIDENKMLTPQGRVFFNSDPFAGDIDPPTPAAENEEHIPL